MGSGGHGTVSVLGHGGDDGFELAFGIDEEEGAGDDAFTGLKAVEHGPEVVGAMADADLSGFEVVIGALDEDDRACAGVDDGIGGDGEVGAEVEVEGDGDPHFGSEEVLRVGNHEAELAASSGGIEVR